MADQFKALSLVVQEYPVWPWAGLAAILVELSDEDNQ